MASRSTDCSHAASNFGTGRPDTVSQLTVKTGTFLTWTSTIFFIAPHCTPNCLQFPWGVHPLSLGVLPVMRVLTMCQGGHVRSVGLKRLLTYGAGCDVIACGCETNSTEVRTLLCEWADLIIVMQPFIECGVPEKYRSKMICYDVGPDVWSWAEHPELQAKLTDLMNRDGRWVKRSPEVIYAKEVTGPETA